MVVAMTIDSGHGKFWTIVALCALSLARAAAAEGTPPLDIEGLTFVASRGGSAGVIVWADTARFHTDEDTADLQRVRARVSLGSDPTGFEVECDEGTLDLGRSAFDARGHVRGRTDDGRAFEADWVRYDHDEGVLYTDAPVLITESGTTLRGGGFRYFVRENRFRLLGGATVVQEPAAEAAPAPPRGATP